METSFLFKISLAGLDCLRGLPALISAGLTERARPPISLFFSFMITENVSFDFSLITRVEDSFNLSILFLILDYKKTNFHFLIEIKYYLTH